MGWTLDDGEPVTDRYHQGRVTTALSDGTELDSDDQGTKDIIIGWRSACACGWRAGFLITREVYPSPDGRLDNAGVEAGQLITLMWEQHVRGFLPLPTVTAAELERARASAVLDRAVVDAREAGHSWEAIARAVGITRRSAHQRWSYLVA